MTDALTQSLGGADAVITTGTASINQIAQMFNRKQETVSRLLAQLGPVGRRKGVAVYSIEEAAGYLVKPSFEVEDALKRMNQADLPSLLAKEFWNGQRARLEYEKSIGNSWSTDDVLAVLATTFNEVRMVFMLMLDNVERETSVTPRQREIIKRLSEGGINACKEALVTAFEGHEAPQDNIAGPMPEEAEL